MQKTLKNQQGREFLLLELPSDVDKVFIDVSDYYYRSTIGDSFSEPNKFYISLPQGNYQILCLAKDMNADKLLELGLAEKIGLSWNLKTIYSKVPNTDFEKAATTCYKESLTSLLTSLGFKQDDNVLILEKI